MEHQNLVLKRYFLRNIENIWVCTSLVSVFLHPYIHIYNIAFNLVLKKKKREKIIVKKFRYFHLWSPEYFLVVVLMKAIGQKGENGVCSHACSSNALFH